MYTQNNHDNKESIMKNLIILLTCLGISASLFAENPQTEMKKKRIVIKTHSDSDERSIKDIISWVESKTDGDNNVEVYVTIDDDGEMTIEKNGEIIDMKGMHKFTGVPHVMAFSGSQHRAPHRRHMNMSEGVASCILKNISKINSDSAAHLLKQACISLNPTEEKSEE